MSKKTIRILIICLLIYSVINIINPFEKVFEFIGKFTNVVYKDDTIHVLSSYDNSILESKVVTYAKKKDIDVSFTYMGDLEIVDELNNNSPKYDAVWISNSMWLYMLDNSYLTSNSKSISISPVVVGIKKSKANDLGLVNKNVTNNDILKLIQNKKIKYVMSSVTRTNTGATAYFGFLDALAGNPEILTEKILKDENLITKLTDVFSGVERVSGDENYLEEMFLNNSSYEAVIADEASLININKNLVSRNMDPLYLLYPTDGVPINDSTFAFIDNGKDKEEMFLTIQNYLLSDNGQKMLEEKGLRTWYGGINNNASKDVFNPSWGIDTTKYLNVTKYPSKDIMTKAINLYIERLRKPTHVVFCLDYSGSMHGEGNRDLVSAMKYILDYDEASKDKLQFSIKDKITVITFGSSIKNVWSSNNGIDTEALITNIKNEKVTGSTDLYSSIIRGLNILKNENDDYTKTVIAMTDGEVNVSSFSELSRNYINNKYDIPVYSIAFGYADYRQLEDISKLTNAKVFDGKTNLLGAFKEVRGYN